jgi:hypothetical protein
MATLIHLSCHDHYLLMALHRALIAHCQVEVLSDFGEFSRIPGTDVCRVLVLCERANQDTFDLLTKLVRRPGKPTIECAQPLIIIEKEGWPEHRFPRDEYRRVPNRTISASEIDELVWAAVQQEHARATLEMINLWIENAPGLSSALRGALRAAVSLEDPVTSVTEDSGIAGRSRMTLHRHWAKSGISGFSLADMVCLILLLRTRARKTTRVSWDNLAEENRISVDRVRRIERRLTGGWSGAEDGIGAIDLATRVRSSLLLCLQ